MLMGLALWLMVWGTYNAEIWRLFEPDFPANALDLFHGLRTLLPFVAAYLAIIMLLARRSLPLRLFQGPLGLLALYTLVGIVSSILLSREPLTALYWAAQYASVLLVLWVFMANSNPLPHLSRLINLNWLIIVMILAALLVALLFLAGTALVKGGPLGVMVYVGHFAATGTILDMPTTRNTGFGRWAAIAALVALAQFWQGATEGLSQQMANPRWSRIRRLRPSTPRSKLVWSLILLVALFALVLSQARTAVLGFLAGGFVLLWLRSRSKGLFLTWALVAVVLLGVTGFYQAFWNYLTRGAMVFDITLSGRVTGAWQEGWRLFQESPLLGFGFHADRIFLDQHMHNALLHALVQTGLLGTMPFVAALVGAWVLILRLARARLPGSPPLLPMEIPAVLAFFTVQSITESTFAFFGAAWLICAPLLAYVYTLNRTLGSVNRGNHVH